MNDLKFKSIIIFFTIVFVLDGLIVFTSNPLFSFIPEALVHEDKLEPAEAIVVLSRPGTGNRMEAGYKLFAKGFGEVIIFSGVQLYPGFYEYTLIKEHAIKLGVPENKLIAKGFRRKQRLG